MNSHNLNENFDFNPKNRNIRYSVLTILVALITDKPMAIKQVSSDIDNFALKTKLDILTMVPKKKYPFAVTSAQEVGWDNDEVRILFT
jgi:FAM183A and FAM183B related